MGILYSFIHSFIEKKNHRSHITRIHKNFINPRIPPTQKEKRRKEIKTPEHAQA